jgi:hypothetical protein
VHLLDEDAQGYPLVGGRAEVTCTKTTSHNYKQ